MVGGKTISWAVLAACGALMTACAQPVRDRSLADLDLADRATLESLQAALPLDDRGALGTYALLHWPKSRFYCGRPADPSSRPAQTVGEAIEQTRLYEAQYRLAVAKTPVSAKRDDRASRDRDLVFQIEQLVTERDMLRSRKTSEATTRTAEIDNQISKLRVELGALRAIATP